MQPPFTRPLDVPMAGPLSPSALEGVIYPTESVQYTPSRPALNGEVLSCFSSAANNVDFVRGCVRYAIANEAASTVLECTDKPKIDDRSLQETSFV